MIYLLNIWPTKNQTPNNSVRKRRCFSPRPARKRQTSNVHYSRSAGMGCGFPLASQPRAMSRAGLCRLPRLRGPGAHCTPRRRRAIDGDDPDPQASQAGLPRRPGAAGDDRAAQTAIRPNRRALIAHASRDGLACHQSDDAPRRHRRPYGLPQGAAPWLRDPRSGPQRAHEPHTALDGPRFAHDDCHLS